MGDKIIECVKRIFRKLLRLKPFITIICILILLQIIFFSFKENEVKNFADIYTSEVALCNVNYIVQIILGCVLIIGGIIAVWQYLDTTRNQNIVYKTDKIRKSIELVEYYKNEIIGNYAIIDFVFEQTGIKCILNRVKPCDIKNFNTLEINKLFTTEDVDKLNKFKNSPEMASAVLNASEIMETDLKIDQFLIKTVDENNEKILAINTHKLLSKFMADVINKTLNNMEYFAMNFTHNTADETVAYESVHQTYGQIVLLLYYNIANINKTGSGINYYTNLIELYLKWYKREEKCKEEIEKKCSKKQKGTVI